MGLVSVNKEDHIQLPLNDYGDTVAVPVCGGRAGTQLVDKDLFTGLSSSLYSSLATGCYRQWK